ncbi:MAG: hypothetical protein V3S24_19985, partial [Candidatus Tectomicrobia bacterium]
PCALLALAASRFGGQPLRAGVATIAVCEGRPQAQACDRGGGAKKAFVFPILFPGPDQGSCFAYCD